MACPPRSTHLEGDKSLGDMFCPQTASSLAKETLPYNQWVHVKHVMEEQAYVFFFSTLLKTLFGTALPQKDAQITTLHASDSSALGSLECGRLATLLLCHVCLWGLPSRTWSAMGTLVRRVHRVQSPSACSQMSLVRTQVLSIGPRTVNIPGTVSKHVLITICAIKTLLCSTDS